MALSNSQKRLYALGRLKTGEMNKTERAYANYLETLKQSGEIKDYWFEAVKLRVASNACTYTPDFMVLRADGTLELHEVKGSERIFTDDAKVKCKVVADMYPFRLLVAIKSKQGWILKEF